VISYGFRLSGLPNFLQQPSDDSLQLENEKRGKNGKNGKNGRTGKNVKATSYSSQSVPATITTAKCTLAHEITAEARDRAYTVRSPILGLICVYRPFSSF